MNILRISAKKEDANLHLAEVWAKGGEGGMALAEKVIEYYLKTRELTLKPLYADDMSIKEKIETIATEDLRSRWCYICSCSRESYCKILKKWDMENILYVWQRTSIHCQMIKTKLRKTYRI